MPPQEKDTALDATNIQDGKETNINTKSILIIPGWGKEVKLQDEYFEGY